MSYVLSRNDEFFKYGCVRYNITTVMKIIYGRGVDSMDDPYVLNAERLAGEDCPGSSLIDLVPFCKSHPCLRVCS